jgi:hypothetical protein
MNRCLKARSIYEYDLKSFFDKVKIKRTIEQIEELGITKAMRVELESISSSYPELPVKELLDESGVRSKEEHSKYEKALWDLFKGNKTIIELFWRLSDG